LIIGLNVIFERGQLNTRLRSLTASIETKVEVLATWGSSEMVSPWYFTVTYDISRTYLEQVIKAGSDDMTLFNFLWEIYSLSCDIDNG
jgi:hypothetical protein